mgnify:CR=1 FL=1
MIILKNWKFSMPKTLINTKRIHDIHDYFLKKDLSNTH